MIDFFNEKTELNEKTFDKEELFECVLELLLRHHISVDDFKGNISYCENEGFSDIPGDFYISCNFEWIMYDDDVNRANFRFKAAEIEKLLEESFKACEEVSCVRYRGDSLYSGGGYDVCLTLRLSYPLAS